MPAAGRSNETRSEGRYPSKSETILLARTEYLRPTPARYDSHPLCPSGKALRKVATAATLNPETDCIVTSFRCESLTMREEGARMEPSRQPGATCFEKLESSMTLPSLSSEANEGGAGEGSLKGFPLKLPSMRSS